MIQTDFSKSSTSHLYTLHSFSSCPQLQRMNGFSQLHAIQSIITLIDMNINVSIYLYIYIQLVYIYHCVQLQRYPTFCCGSREPQSLWHSCASVSTVVAQLKCEPAEETKRKPHTERCTNMAQVNKVSGRYNYTHAIRQSERHFSFICSLAIKKQNKKKFNKSAAKQRFLPFFYIVNYICFAVFFCLCLHFTFTPFLRQLYFSYSASLSLSPSLQYCLTLLQWRQRDSRLLYKR